MAGPISSAKRQGNRVKKKRSSDGKCVRPGWGIEPQTSRADRDVFNHYAKRTVLLTKIVQKIRVERSRLSWFKLGFPYKGKMLGAQCVFDFLIYWPDFLLQTISFSFIKKPIFHLDNWFTYITTIKPTWAANNKKIITALCGLASPFKSVYRHEFNSTVGPTKPAISHPCKTFFQANNDRKCPRCVVKFVRTFIGATERSFYIIF